MKPLTSQLPIYKLAEWRTLHLKGEALTIADQALIQRLATGSESRISVDELKDGLRLTSRSWVGVLRFHGFELQVVPKLVGDNLGLVELIDYSAGLNALDRYPTVRTFDGGGSSLFDLIALLLVESCERVLRGGILSDYCEVEEQLSVVRGRLLTDRQVLKRFGRLDRLECRYDEYLTDVLENQILLMAFSTCAGHVRHPTVSMRVRRLLAIFSEVCSVGDLNIREARPSLVYNRRNENYREAHELAWLILDGLGIEDVYAAGSQRCFAFLLDMNRLFEAFIIRWLRQIVTKLGIRALPQRRDRTILWNAGLARPHAAVIPDLLLERNTCPGKFLPIDAKYKLYDQRSVATSDIYQTFLYAYAFGEEHPMLPTAIILYPASSPATAQMNLHVRRSSGATSAQLCTIPIHIPTALKEARMNNRGPMTQMVLQRVIEALGKQ